MSVPEKIRKILDEHKVDYKYSEHEEARTSEESAKARGEDLKIGAKAMVLKDEKGNFVMLVLSAVKKIDSKKAREILGAKKLQFATPEEVFEKTGCIVGGIPPFAPLFDIDYFVDKSVVDNEDMAFNIGERTKSVKMKTKDYLRVMKPKIAQFSCN